MTTKEIAAAIRATQRRIATADPPTDMQAQQLRGVRRAAAHIAAILPRDQQTAFLIACGYGATTMNPRDPALDLRPLPGEEQN